MKISKYARKYNPSPYDLLIGTDNTTGKTYNFTIGDIINAGNGIPSDTENPIMGELTPIDTTETTASFSWEAATDNIGVAGYSIYQDGSLLTTTVNTIYTATNLVSGATYIFSVRAIDLSGNMSDPSELTMTTDNVAVLSNLTYGGFTTLTKIGNSIATPNFTWSVTGIPTNLRLSDNIATLTNQAVSGSSYQSAVTYSRNVYGNLTWTLQADNSNSTTKTTTWVWSTYSGKNTTGVLPDESTILAGTSYTMLTNGSVQINMPTTSSEYLWIAIPEDALQTGARPTKWFISLPFNFGDIDDFGFIAYKGLVSVNGKNYYLFMYNYPSEVLLPIQINK